MWLSKTPSSGVTGGEIGSYKVVQLYDPKLLPRPNTTPDDGSIKMKSLIQMLVAIRIDFNNIGNQITDLKCW